MKRAVDNFPNRFAGMAGFFVLPAVLAVFSGAGVAILPVGELGHSRSRNDHALERAAQLRSFERSAQGFLSAQGFDRVGRARRVVDAFAPAGTTRMESFSVVRLAADENAVELTRLSVGELYDPGLAVLSDQLLMREVQLNGRGDLLNILGFVRGIPALGQPVSILDFSFQRFEPEDAEFEFRASLGLVQSFPAPPAVQGETDDLDPDSDESEDD